MNNEFTQTVSPENENEQGPTVAEVVDLAWKSGLIDTDVRNDWMDSNDMNTILGKLREIIIQDDQDPSEIFARWGVVARAEES